MNGFGTEKQIYRVWVFIILPVENVFELFASSRKYEAFDRSLKRYQTQHRALYLVENCNRAQKRTVLEFAGILEFTIK